MSAESYDEVAARRDRRGVQPQDTSDHRTRLDYDSVAELLADADRLLEDMKAVGNGQLLVPWADLDFTVRRLQRVLVGASVAVTRVEAQS